MPSNHPAAARRRGGPSINGKNFYGGYRSSDIGAAITQALKAAGLMKN
jgi:hypothetical protein